MLVLSHSRSGHRCRRQL